MAEQTTSALPTLVNDPILEGVLPLHETSDMVLVIRIRRYGYMLHTSCVYESLWLSCGGVDFFLRSLTWILSLLLAYRAGSLRGAGGTWRRC